MARKQQHRRNASAQRILLAALLIASVACVAVYAREGEQGPLHTLQGGVSGAFAPAGTVGAAGDAAVGTVADVFGDVTAGDDTLSGLRDYNEQLVRQYAQMQEYKEEAERLQDLLDLKDLYSLEGTGARVMGRSAQAWSQTVTIDKGANDGVDSGFTVLGTSGVVGQVVSVTDTNATVRLLSDPQSGAAAMVQASRAEGVVRGSLDGLLYLEDLDAGAQVDIGDVVVTSGLGGSYARGLMIGTVVKIDSRQGDSSRRIVVAPNDEIAGLSEVFVVTGSQQDSQGGDAA